MDESKSGTVAIDHWYEGQHYEFKSMSEFQKWKKSELIKKHPQIPKLEAELNELEQKEKDAFDNARETYKEITIQNQRITQALSDKADRRIVESLQQDLEKLAKRPEILQHQKIQSQIHMIEAKLRGLRSKR